MQHNHDGVPRSFFHEVYQTGIAPWDIGAPQPAIVKLNALGLIHGTVLDVGTGTGDNAIFLAEQGFEVTACDVVPEAIVEAQRRAAQKQVQVAFRQADALNLTSLNKTFDTVIDSAVFHIFSDEDRMRLVQSVHGVLKPGGRLFVLCFSDKEPPGIPRRVTEAELRDSFREGWRMESIDATRFFDRGRPEGGHAWLAHITRI